MRPTPLSGVLILFAFISVVYAVLLNDAKAAAAAVAILAVIIIRAYIFQNRLKKFISDSVISRKTDVLILKQGGIVSVSSELETPSADFSYNAEDIIPSGALITSGSSVFENGKAEYKIRMPIMGKSPFGGIKFKCRDLFAETDITINNASVPELNVYPSGIAATINKSSGTGFWTDDEIDRIAIIQGTETRTFRPYQTGDNTKNIDWKMSARYDKLYIREKNDASGNYPMVIIDLPDAGTDVEITADFLNAAEGVLENMRRLKNIPVVFISGADFIGVTLSESHNEINSYLAMAGKVKRENYLYHLRHCGTLRSSADNITDRTMFAEKIKNIMNRTAGRYQSDFEKISLNIAGGMTEISSVTVVTAALGDISHLLHITSDCAAFNKKVSFVIAGSNNNSRYDYIINELYKAGSENVEAVS